MGTPVAAPSPALMFVVMFGLVCASLGLIFVLAMLTKAFRWLRSPEGQVRAFEVARRAANGVQTRSGQQNAEKAARSEVQEVKEGSVPNPPAATAQADAEPAPQLPATAEELAQLAHIIVLYTKRPNKEGAILEVTGVTKGGSAEYQRWSALFDAALPIDGPGRAAAKARPAKPARSAPPDSGRSVRSAAASPAPAGSG